MIGKDERMATIRMDMQVVTVFDIYNKIKLHYMDISPEYARRFRWPEEFQRRLIESILEGFPISNIIVQEYQNGYYRIIDGVQRLNTIINFLDDRFCLDDENKKVYYSDLSAVQKRIIQDCQIVMYIIREKSDEIATQVFKRINMSVSGMTAQENRNFLFRDQGMPFVKQLAKMKEFQRIIKGKDVNCSQMQDEELVLRFLSFYYKGYQGYNGRMNEFLKNTLADYVNYRKREEDTKRVFEQACEKAYDIWGDSVFVVPKHIRRGKKKRLNTALYDVIMYSCAYMDIQTVFLHGKELRERLDELLDINTEFRNSVIGNSNTSRKNVDTRFRIWMKNVEQICGES